MKRQEFLKIVALSPLAACAPKIMENLNALPKTNIMPAIFMGHGSPMNAIEENKFVQGFRAQVASIPKPAAILCVSAHWETRGSQITAMEKPRTIHDFGGFPPALYQVQYPAPGSPNIAAQTQQLIASTPIISNMDWGLDHGCWSVVKHLYPNADVPVLQLSLDINKTPAQHYALAQELAVLRQRGVLIIGSGNMVHHLGLVAWDKVNQNYAYDWALEANHFFKTHIINAHHTPLLNYQSQGKAVNTAIPSPEHFLPLLYVLALQQKNEEAILFNDEALGGSLSMTSVRFG